MNYKDNGRYAKCTTCVKYKNRWDDFYYRAREGHQERYGMCKTCDKDAVLRAVKWYNENKEWVKHKQLLSKYGIGYDEWLILKEIQDYKCNICNKDLSSDRMGTNVDHCHNTGKVRGILYNCCNLGLGKFKDNKELLKEALEYLEHFDES